MARDVVRDLVSTWIERADITQSDLAKQLDISSPSFSTMLSGKIALPLPRFLQIVHLLSPSQADIDRAFEAYLQDLEIPSGSMKLQVVGKTTTKDVRKRCHELLDEVPDNALATIQTMLEYAITNKR